MCLKARNVLIFQHFGFETVEISCSVEYGKKILKYRLHEKYNVWEFANMKKYIFQHFNFYEQLKFHAQLS